MRRLGTDDWAGLAMLALSVGVAAPILFGGFEPTIPRLWWIALFLLFMASLFGAVAVQRPALRYGAYATSVVTSWAVVLTAQTMGMLLILIVLVAAMGAYVVPLRACFVVIGLNTVVIGIATLSISPSVPESLITTGFYLLIQLATLLSTTTLIREQRMRRELAEAHVELQAASILLSESTRTAERLRISRELHDLIGHQLTVLTLELETARHLDSDGGREHLERADRVARELLNDVRGTVGQLRTEAPDLDRAFRKMTDALPGLDVSIDVSPQLRIGEDQSAALVRAAQEIVTNTIRHAEARELWIEIKPVDDEIVLVARDDGRGAQQVAFGNGLLGLRERFTELGGTIAVDGSSGFSVTARVPAA